MKQQNEIAFRKVRLNPPEFRFGDIFRWTRQFEKWLDYEGVGAAWDNYVKMAFNIRDYDTFIRAVNKGEIDIQGIFAENIPRIYKAFNPMFSRTMLLREIDNLHPRPNELLNDYCSRFQLMSTILQDTDIPTWMLAEKFVQSLPQYFIDKMHETALNLTEYESLDSAMEHARRLWANKMSQPLLLKETSGSYSFQPSSNRKRLLVK